RGVVLMGGRLGRAADPQQDRAGDDADQGDATDIVVPEIAGEIAHDGSLYRGACRQSSWNGNRAASSKSALLRLDQAQITMPTKVSRLTVVTMLRRSLMSMGRLLTAAVPGWRRYAPCPGP